MNYTYINFKYSNKRKQSLYLYYSKKMRKYYLYINIQNGTLTRKKYITDCVEITEIWPKSTKLESQFYCFSIICKGTKCY